MATQKNFGNNIEGLRAALRTLPKDAKAELKEASKEIAGDVASDAKAQAASLVSRHGAWKYLGPTIRAGAAQEPNVKIGGSKRMGKHQGRVGDVLWGLEFGGGRRPTTQQFLPWLGKTGYALWPTVREHDDDTANRYSEALLSALEAM